MREKARGRWAAEERQTKPTKQRVEGDASTSAASAARADGRESAAAATTRKFTRSGGGGPSWPPANGRS